MDAYNSFLNFKKETFSSDHTNAHGHVTQLFVFILYYNENRCCYYTYKNCKQTKNKKHFVFSFQNE